MMADIPLNLEDIPPYSLWMITGWILTCLISGWSGYRWGLRAQRDAEMLKAKNAIFAEIDKALVNAEISDNLRPLLRTSQAHLERFVFSVSSQLRSERRRARIEAAWTSYQKLDTGDVFPTTYGAFNDPAAIAKARARMSQPLKNLRNEIHDA